MPWDVGLLAKLSQTLISINQTLLENKSSKSSLYSKVRRKVDTEDVSIWTGKVLIASNVTPNPDSSHVNWSTTFDINFKSTPVVTATVFCDSTGGGTIAPSAVWIHEVTPTGVKGKFKWLGKTSKKETVYVMLVAVGEGSPT